MKALWFTVPAELPANQQPASTVSHMSVPSWMSSLDEPLNDCSYSDIRSETPTQNCPSKPFLNFYFLNFYFYFYKIMSKINWLFKPLSLI